jgi:hypothetical protein
MDNSHRIGRIPLTLAVIGLASCAAAWGANVVPNEIQQPGTQPAEVGNKLQFRGSVGPSTLTYKDTGLTSRVTYTYVVTAWTDCNANGAFDAGVDTESAVSNKASATAQ